MGLRGVDLAGTTSVAQALRAVEDAGRRRGGRPVFALNWQEHDWVEDRAMTAAEFPHCLAPAPKTAASDLGEVALHRQGLSANCGRPSSVARRADSYAAMSPSIRPHHADVNGERLEPDLSSGRVCPCLAR